MAVVHFYEKTGCAGNRKQKALLETAGHEVRARDLRDLCWSRERLLQFFGSLPVKDWFNRAAPAVKDGSVVPEALSADEALALLQENPLLIRRPLMEVDGTRMVGFDAQAVNAWIGLGPAPLPEGNLEACSHSGSGPSCRDPRSENQPAG